MSRPSALRPSAMRMAADSAPTIRLAVDCMGGDHGPSVTLPACRAFLAAHPAGRAVARRPRRRACAGGRAGRAAPASPRARSSRWTTRSRWRCAARRIRRCASRSSRSSRMPTGRRSAQACVSAGNTGALMAVSRYVLKTLDGIDRPAIATVMPNERDGYTTVLDLGANVDCTRRAPAAVRGDGQRAGRRGRGQGRADASACSTSARRRSRAARRSSAPASCCARRPPAGCVNFHGNVEGNDIFKGTTDIVVCDGFVGNVALKTAEGLAAMLTSFIKQEFTRNAADQAGGAGRAAGAEPLQAPRRPSPLQRRRAARPARPGVQEPRLGRCLRLRAGAQPRL